MQASVIEQENSCTFEEIYIKEEPHEETIFDANQSVMVVIKSEFEDEGSKARKDVMEKLKAVKKETLSTSMNYTCKYCKKTYKSSQGCSDHEKTHTQEIPICKICNKSYSTHSNLYQHLKVHTKQRFQCDKCQQEFVYKQTLKKHLFSKHLDKNYDRVQCKFCKNFYIKGGHIKRHIENVHLKYKQFECGICDASFTERSSLRTHLALVHKKVDGGVKFKCQICKVPYFSRTDFELHQKTHETKTKDKKIVEKVTVFEHSQVCLESNVIVKEELIIDDAQNEDSNEMNFGKTKKKPVNERYHCKICDKIYNDFYRFKTHTKLHSNGFFGCEICGKEFTRKETLQRHMIISHIQNTERVVFTSKRPLKQMTVETNSEVEKFIKELEIKRQANNKRRRRNGTLSKLGTCERPAKKKKFEDEEFETYLKSLIVPDFIEKVTPENL